MGRFIPNENTIVLFTLTAPGGIDAPVPSAAATATTGGTKIAGTYNYKIVALNALGHSLPSAIESETVPSGTTTNTVTVNWGTVTGASGGYDIYEEIGSVYRKIGHVASGTLTFVDTGSAVPGVKLVNTDTSGDISSPSFARDVENAIDLTDLCMSFNASSQGNAVPTPSFARLFETSILGTSQATFTADFYRDDEDDLAWDTLPRATRGFFLVTRYGGAINEGDTIEVWPVTVLSQAMANMANNTVVSFTLTCAVPKEPDEHAVVVA